MDGVSHNDTVRGKGIMITTLTPALSRQRERVVQGIFMVPGGGSGQRATFGLARSRQKMLNLFLFLTFVLLRDLRG
jgi:hypothetical protein